MSQPPLDLSYYRNEIEIRYTEGPESIAVVFVDLAVE